MHLLMTITKNATLATTLTLYKNTIVSPAQYRSTVTEPSVANKDLMYSILAIGLQLVLLIMEVLGIILTPCKVCLIFVVTKM